MLASPAAFVAKKPAYRSVREEDDRLGEATREALDLVPQMIWVMRFDGSGEYFNRAWRSYTGLPWKPGMGGSWLHWVHPEDRNQAQQELQRLSEPGAVFSGEYRLRDSSGKYYWFLVQARSGRSEGLWLGSCTNIHEALLRQESLDQQVRTQRDMLDISVDCIKVIDTEGSVSTMNRSGCLALGVSEQSGFGMKWLPLLPKEVHRRGGQALRLAGQGKNSRFPGMSQLPGKKTQYWDNILTPLQDETGKTRSILCVSREVTLQREAEMRLRVASETDSLTGLLNRRAFGQKLKQIIRRSRRSGTQFGILLIDLDHFKQINDTLGHDAGDHLLRTTSKRLERIFSEIGYVARIGGDEMVVVITDVRKDEEMTVLAKRALSSIARPIKHGGKQILGGASIGGAMFPRDGKDIDTLARCSDAALNDLKANGRGGFRMFDAGMLEHDEQIVGQLALAGQIVRSNTVEPLYSARVQLEDRRIVGFEAFLRWRDAHGVLRRSSDIAEAYKDYELATQLSHRLRERVFTDFCLWRSKGLALLPISFNAAPAEFMRDDFAERFLHMLERFHIPCSLIAIEVTEQTLSVRGSEFVIGALRKLREQGVRISLDNFGTGASNLAHLGDYPVDGLTIEPGFVRRMEQERSILSIVQMVGMLGRNLSLEVVAKGIQTEQQRQMLQDFGYKIGQGALLSRLLTSEQMETCLSCSDR